MSFLASSGGLEIKPIFSFPRTSYFAGRGFLDVEERALVLFFTRIQQRNPEIPSLFADAEPPFGSKARRIQISLRTFCLRNIVKLDLSGLELKVVPVEIGLFERAVELNLEKNQLESLPKSFERMKSLKTLFLTQNVFSEIPESLFSCTGIETLFFEKNRLRNIPEDIFRMCNLRDFYIEENKLRDLSSFEKVALSMEKLSFVSVLGNPLFHVPERLGKLFYSLSVSAYTLTPW